MAPPSGWWEVQVGTTHRWGSPHPASCLVDRPTPCGSACRKIWPLLHRVRAQTFHGSPHPHQETWDLLAEARGGRFRHGHKPVTPHHRDEHRQTLDFPPDARRSVGSVNTDVPVDTVCIGSIVSSLEFRGCGWYFNNRLLVRCGGWRQTARGRGASGGCVSFGFSCRRLSAKPKSDCRSPPCCLYLCVRNSSRTVKQGEPLGVTSFPSHVGTRLLEDSPGEFHVCI